MSGSIFYNNKSTQSETHKPRILYKKQSNTKINVDINQLLNRVKKNNKNEKKQKIILSVYAILLLSFMTIFISVIK